MDGLGGDYDVSVPLAALLEICISVVAHRHWKPSKT